MGVARVRTSCVVVAVVSGLAALGCRGRVPDPETASRPPRPERTQVPQAEGPGGPNVPWSRKTEAQRIEYMGLVVFPEMRALFQKHSQTAYARFRCQTCHGENMVEAKYAMPNGLFALPKVDPAAAAAELDHETTTFMVEVVQPALKRLLGTDDPATAARVTCHSCHAVE